MHKHTKHCLMLAGLNALILTGAFLQADEHVERRYIKILAKDPATNGRAIMPVVAPIVFVRQTKGPVLPEDKGSTACHWSEKIVNAKPVVVGDCDQGVELVVTGIDLNY